MTVPMTRRERLALDAMRDNSRAREVWNMCNEVLNDPDTYHSGWYRFRTCKAEVLTCVNNETGDHLYLLCSYNTVVAGVLESYCGGVRVFYCVDMLRKVYGYTATSAQHIAKFFHYYADNPAAALNAGEAREKARVIRFRHDGGREQGETADE